jgi:hypothetical protein
MKLESSGYFNAMDRNKDINAIGRFGTSTNPTQNQLRELQAKIMKGTSNVELGFMGRGKGNAGQGALTPGSYGKDEREAMRDLAKINDIKLSVHASTGVGSWSGLSQNKFDENAREQNIMEGKRTIEFTADVAGGGPIVVHTAEFPRAISDVPKKDRGKFEGFPSENSTGTGKDFKPGQKIHYLVDKRNGAILNPIREDQVNHIPAYIEEKEGQEKRDTFGEKYEHVKWKGKPGGKLAVTTKTWDDYVKKADEEHEKTGKDMGEEYAAVLFYKDKLSAQKAHSQGQAGEYELMYHDAKNKLDYLPEKIKAAKETNMQLKPAIEQLKNKNNKTWDDNMNLSAAKKNFEDNNLLIENEKELRTQYIKKMNYGKETAASARAQEADLDYQAKQVVTVSKYAKEKTAESLARMALYAKEVQETNPNVKRDLFIAPENIFPEMGYGSHPDEIKEIIMDARTEMEKQLKDGSPGITNKKAEEIAARHIKATFDIGHAHTWKKYFKRNSGESFEKHHERFTKWMMDKVEDLQTSGVLGHVHITDNFGYYDEHISPGQGNVPIKDFLKKLEDLGYKDQITVESAQQDYKALTEMWRVANSPIYKIDSTSRGWTDVENGYFAQTRSPEFLFGPTAPDPRTWSPWSETPME